MDSGEIARPAGNSLRRKRGKSERYGKQILAGYDSGKSIRQIGRELHISGSAIARYLDRISQDNQSIERFRQTRGEALAGLHGKALSLQDRIIESLGEEGVFAELTINQKQGLLHALTIAGGTAFDKERIERGQSTANISVLSKLLDRQVSTVHKRRVIPPVVSASSHNVGESGSD